jgi:hypothetical protein
MSEEFQELEQGCIWLDSDGYVEAAELVSYETWMKWNP